MGEGFLFHTWLEDCEAKNIIESIARDGVMGILFAYETWLRSYALIDVKQEENFNNSKEIV